MTPPWCDGAGLLAAFRAGVANLEANVEQVNSMNVFPVPDGDTGSNMVATARAALAEAERVRDTDAGLICAAISRGALAGAQGNSGVIASQIARGVADALAGTDRIGGRQLATALERGATTAYAAVVAPVEGTMLTVIRDAADAAQATAIGSDDAVAVLRAAVDAAESSVARTPTLLSVLREAGVADAGGEGLYLLFAGALDSLGGTAPHRRPTEAIARPLVPVHGPDGFGFETMFRLEPASGQSLDVAAIRSHLGSVGHSVVVAGDGAAATVHVHGAVPDEVLAYAGRLGTLTRVTVEDLDRQARDAFGHAVTVIVVVAGPGFVELFEGLGATVIAIARSGQAAPAGDLWETIAGAPAGEVIIVPTDASGRAAGDEASSRGERRVRVLPTRNAAEAAAAMLALDRTKESGAIAAAMTAAAGRVQSFAVKPTADDDHVVAVAADGTAISVGPDVEQATLGGLEALTPGFELVTLYHGAVVDRDAADALGRSIAARLPEIDVEIVRGGQPDSLYLIAAE